jgi:hypothetical protein
MKTKAEFCRLRLRFETPAAILRQPQYASGCRRTLAYWTSITDQSVPYALLDFTVHDVPALGLDSVAGAPGVGIKKLNGLLQILERVYLRSDEIPAVHSPAVVPLNSFAKSNRR